MVNNMKCLTDFFARQVEDHRSQFLLDEDLEKAGNYVQAFLIEAKKREDSGDVGYFT